MFKIANESNYKLETSDGQTQPFEDVTLYFL